MSRSEARVVGTLSYGETQLPETAAQLESVTTFVPSLFRTAGYSDNQPVSKMPEELNCKLTLSGVA